jgi:hypothetical protein
MNKIMTVPSAFDQSDFASCNPTKTSTTSHAVTIAVSKKIIARPPSTREPMRNFCIQPRRKQRQEKPPQQCYVVTRTRLLKAKREDQNH